MGRIKVNYKNLNFTFKTNPRVFSPNQLDMGSKLLLDAVSSSVIPDVVLDIGCGYGPAGIILAKLAPFSDVLMIDNDSVAVRLAQENITINRTPNAHAIRSDASLDVINRQFDLAVTNPPWTKNISVIPPLIRFAFEHLKKGGAFYLVINKTFRTEDTIESLFENVEVIANFQSYKVLRAVKRGEIDPLRKKVVSQLESLNISPDFIKGQNFLVSTKHLDRIVEEAKIKKNETISEIGPGLGQLTERLARYAKEVITLEVDERFRPVLDKLPGNVEVIYGNAWNILARHMSNVKFDKFISNIPYSLSEPLMHKLAHVPAVPIIIVLSEKFSANLLNHHIFSAVFEMKVLFGIPRFYFYPMPKTNSVVMQLCKSAANVSKENVGQWIRRFIYENEGRTLKNILRLAIEKIFLDLKGKKLTKNQAREIVEKLGLDSNILERGQYSAEVYDQVSKAIKEYFS